MDSITEPRGEIGMKAQALVKDFLAHDGNDDYLNTLVAIFTMKSTPVRLAYHPTSPTFTNLFHDFIWVGQDKRLCDYDNNPTPRPSSSAASKLMRDNKVHRRLSQKRLPLTRKTYAALLAYTEEKISLLRRAEELFNDGSKLTSHAGVRRWAASAAKERKPIERLRTWLINHAALVAE